MSAFYMFKFARDAVESFTREAFGLDTFTQVIANKNNRSLLGQNGRMGESGSGLNRCDASFVTHLRAVVFLSGPSLGGTVRDTLRRVG